MVHLPTIIILIYYLTHKQTHLKKGFNYNPPHIIIRLHYLTHKQTLEWIY